MLLLLGCGEKYHLKTSWTSSCGKIGVAVPKLRCEAWRPLSQRQAQGAAAAVARKVPQPLRRAHRLFQPVPQLMSALLPRLVAMLRLIPALRAG